MKYYLVVLLVYLILFILFIFYTISICDKKKLITSISKMINPIYERTSLIGNYPFYDDSTLETSKFLTKNWKTFRDEALATYKSYTTITNDLFFRGILNHGSEWTKLYIKWYSDIDSIAKSKCPKSCEIIESLSNITVAMFSVLLPRAKIKPHKGPYKGCLRYHLGLCTPNSDDCYIDVDNIKYSWRDGEGILFDDTFTHWVENNTDKVRIILFCDIIRPMKFMGKHLNKFILNNFGNLTSRGN